MNEASRDRLAFFASQLAWIAALIHVAYGLLQWYRRIQYDIWVPKDLRIPLFLLSGGALILGLYLGARAEDKRPYYLGGIAILLGYVVGYFAWHFFGHRPYILVGPGAPHGTLSLQWFLDHLLAGPVEFAAILVEVLGAALLGILYVTED